MYVIRTLKSAVSVLWCGRNPDWNTLKRLFFQHDCMNLQKKNSFHDFPQKWKVWYGPIVDFYWSIRVCFFFLFVFFLEIWSLQFSKPGEIQSNLTAQSHSTILATFNGGCVYHFGCWILCHTNKQPNFSLRCLSFGCEQCFQHDVANIQFSSAPRWTSANRNAVDTKGKQDNKKFSLYKNVIQDSRQWAPFIVLTFQMCVFFFNIFN